RLTIAQQIVGRVTDADKTARIAGDAAIEGELLSTPLFHLQVDVDGLIAVVSPCDGILLFDLFEQSELIQLQDRKVPIAFVVGLAFVDDDFPSQDMISRHRVADELEAVQRELSALINFQRNLDLTLLLRFIYELGYEVYTCLDIALGSVKILDPFEDVLLNHLGIRVLAGLQPRDGSNDARLKNG